MTTSDISTPGTPDAAKEILAPQDVATRRKFCDWLAHWRHCAAPPCRRAHSCMGDPTECLIRNHKRHSEPARVWVFAGLEAIEEGLSARAAARAADAALVRHVKQAAGLPLHERKQRRQA